MSMLKGLNDPSHCLSVSPLLQCI